jgi:catechol 2,3-dioxygenase-like lactoylglutathione lyase family enzyme
MIRGIHGLLYSSDADATRAFFREKLKLPGSDIGHGWWIFDFAEADMGVHPVDYGKSPGGHDISFYCDDIHGTVADLQSRGVELAPIADRGWGLVTSFEAPGGVTIQLYEPRYTKGATRKKATPAKKKRSASKTSKTSPRKTKAKTKRR